MNTEAVLFALIRNVIYGEIISEEVKTACTPEMLDSVHTLAAKHDLAHLVGQAVSKLALPENEALAKCKQAAMSAFARYMQLDYEYKRTCEALEKAQISFMPLKGSVLRAYYPNPWMRTSCDVDILVRKEGLKQAVTLLVKELSYTEKERGTHDVTLLCPSGSHIELHFDLVEEGRANSANTVLEAVWDHAVLRDGYRYWYEMSDPFFYFYHIAHMAKHFETGGCGIRPFIDLWLLDNVVKGDHANRETLLQSGELLRFAQAARKLSCVWFSGEDADDLSKQLQHFLLHGGTYGSTSNRVALQQKRKGGRLRYLFFRIFAPYEKLRGYYPILEKHRWLMPVMQVRRWCMLLRPDVAARAKSEMVASSRLEGNGLDDTGTLLEKLGLHSAPW